VLPTGIAAKLGLARNPYDSNCIPGGSRCGLLYGAAAFWD
jgi:hypothetical protein